MAFGHLLLHPFLVPFLFLCFMIHFRFTSLNFSLYAAYLISRSPARPAPISSESMSGTLLTLRSSMFCYSFRKYKYRSVPRRRFGAALHNAIHDERGRKQNRYRRRNKHSSQRLSHKHSPFKCVQKLFCAKSPGIINIANMVFVFRHSKAKPPYGGLVPESAAH